MRSHVSRLFTRWGGVVCENERTNSRSHFSNALQFLGDTARIPLGFSARVGPCCTPTVPSISVSVSDEAVLTQNGLHGLFALSAS